MTFLQAHFERIQRRLAAEGEAAKSLHHSLNKGLLREAFVRELLQESISPMWNVGTGEIIHKDTGADEQRNQIDVVIHNNRYPKLSLSKGIDLFFVEAVSSFMEIKSTLKKDDLRKFAKVTKNIKSQAAIAPHRFNPTGMVETPRPYSFVFSYDGPSKVETILGWMKNLACEDEYNLKALATTEPEERSFFNSLFIDGVFVLGSGYVLVDTGPLQSPLANVSVSLDHIWISGKENELAILWTLVNMLNEKLMWNDFYMAEYLGMIATWIEK